MNFKDILLQEQINEIGYIKVPFLSPEEVSELKRYISDETPIVEMSKQFGFIQAVCINDKELKINLDKKIRGIIDYKLSVIIEGYKALTYSALAKGIGENSQLDLHQDWSVVDEEKSYSISLWIPLSDSNLENGAVHFLNESHKTFPSIRCGTISHEYGDAEKIKNKMQCVAVKAGEALFFNSRILHYTPNNKSKEIRLAVISCLVFSDAEILQYYKISDSRLEVYKMSDGFFNEYDNFIEEKNLKPKGEKIGEVEFSPFNSLM